jgi:hypothetical protein
LPYQSETSWTFDGLMVNQFARNRAKLNAIYPFSDTKGVFLLPQLSRSPGHVVHRRQ